MWWGLGMWGWNSLFASFYSLKSYWAPSLDGAPCPDGLVMSLCLASGFPRSSQLAGAGVEIHHPKNPTIPLTLAWADVFNSWADPLILALEGIHGDRGWGLTLGLKHKGDIASEPSRGLGWKALLQGQVGQAPEEQARLLSPRSLTWLGPGGVGCTCSLFQRNMDHRLHVTCIMFIHSTDLYFNRHLMRLFYEPDILCQRLGTNW